MATYCKSLVAVVHDCRGQLQANIAVLGWTRAIPYVALKTANMQVSIIARHFPPKYSTANRSQSSVFPLVEQGSSMRVSLQ